MRQFSAACRDNADYVARVAFHIALLAREQDWNVLTSKPLVINGNKALDGNQRPPVYK
ncbi:hypothetical protein [Ruegeria arenilitoris]|uniref:hypothetical protein n=1 Tax=Ruegeria arenilitoris TaxID=1173585 RepID=UPI00147C0258|nr:hypothetical protein [Ruegeria arenilitoris]